MTIAVPEQGQLVRVRERHWVVGEIEADGLPTDPLRPEVQPQHLVTLQAVDDDAEPDETLQVVWEIEPGARAIERAGLPVPTSLDQPARFDAFLNALRWGAASGADTRELLSPFRSGIEIAAYQLDPLVRSLRMPRTGLLIADDVGLGKTIEAGLVVQELILRYRARRVLIVTPADLLLQWRDEMRDKFGLEFRVVDSALVKRLRRERGIHVNPWTHFPRLITSMDYLKQEGPLRRFRETLPSPGEPRYPRRYDVLIVDEAHNVAPASGGRYARESQRTATTRELVPHFEHRLFLTATPHNGYDESFTALLELLDEQRFARGVDPAKETLRQVMVRRLKTELSARFIGARSFPERELVPLEVAYTEEERAAHAKLTAYSELRRKRAREEGTGYAIEFVLKLLKKRLFSSAAAFASTLRKHRDTVAKTSVPDTAKRAARTLRSQARRFDEDTYETEDEYQSAEDSAQRAASEALGGATEEELRLLEELQAWADTAASQRDSKASELLDLIEKTCRPDGEWNDERLIVFTEYRDTQNALFELLASEGLTADGRTLMLHGSLSPEARSDIKEAFQADPGESPVRILLGTDAASEGINLQNHCHRVLHYEIPWNPNRLEQRNGRVDRYLQSEPKVFVYHFVPKGYDEMGSLADVPVGELEGDLEFLRRAVLKVERVREMLGRVGPVIADQVVEAMLGHRRRLDTDKAEDEGRAIEKRLSFERKLEEELGSLRESYDQTRLELRMTPDNVRAAVEVALALAHQPPLEVRDEGLFDLPRLTGPWAHAAEGLEHPFSGRIRPIAFDPSIVGDRDDVVLCHLGHRLAQMSLRLLRAEVWSEPTEDGLQRVTAREVAEGLDGPVAAVHARLVVTGADGHRIHEEIVQAGGEIDRDGRLQRMGVGALETALKSESAGAVDDEPVGEALLALHPKMIDPLVSALEARASERTSSLERLIKKRRDEEIEKTTSIMEELQRRIVEELETERQLVLEFSDDERRQFERDRDFLRARAEEIPAELERERESISRRFSEPSWHVFPAAVEYRVPAGWKPS